MRLTGGNGQLQCGKVNRNKRRRNLTEKNEGGNTLKKKKKKSNAWSLDLRIGLGGSGDSH